MEAFFSSPPFGTSTQHVSDKYATKCKEIAKEEDQLKVKKTTTSVAPRMIGYVYYINTSKFLIFNGCFKYV